MTLEREGEIAREVRYKIERFAEAHGAGRVEIAATKTPTQELEPSRTLQPMRLDTVIGSKGSRRRCLEFSQSLVSDPLPKGSLIDASRVIDVDMPCYITAPELTFVLMARQLSLGQLVVVGLELCGTYNVFGSGLGCAYGLRALTDPQALSGWIATAPAGMRSVARARKACRWVIGGCGSPMEARATTLFCLPSLQGGYAMPLPELNKRIPLDEEARRLVARKELRVDMLWRDERLGVEYESDRYHVCGARDDRIRLDKHRIDVLRRLGFEVRSLTLDIARDQMLFDDFACELRRSLGFRNRRPTERVARARRALHRALMTTSS